MLSVNVVTCTEFVSVAAYDSSRDRLPVEASDPLERWDSYEDFNNITQDFSTEGEYVLHQYIDT